jgi:hypothetical protein
MDRNDENNTIRDFHTFKLKSIIIKRKVGKKIAFPSRNATDIFSIVYTIKLFQSRYKCRFVRKKNNLKSGN